MVQTPEKVRDEPCQVERGTASSKILKQRHVGGGGVSDQQKSTFGCFINLLKTVSHRELSKDYIVSGIQLSLTHVTCDTTMIQRHACFLLSHQPYVCFLFAVS